MPQEDSSRKTQEMRLNATVAGVLTAAHPLIPVLQLTRSLHVDATVISRSSSRRAFCMGRPGQLSQHPSLHALHGVVHAPGGTDAHAAAWTLHRLGRSPQCQPAVDSCDAGRLAAAASKSAGLRAASFCRLPTDAIDRISRPSGNPFSAQLYGGDGMAGTDNTDSLKTAAPRAVTLSREDLQSLRPLGQVDNKFIVCHADSGSDAAEDGRGCLIIVDQHAADERVRLEEYEQGLEDLQHAQSIGVLSCRSLDAPYRFSLTARQHLMWRDNRCVLEAWQFAIAEAEAGVQDAPPNGDCMWLECTALPVVYGEMLTIADLREVLDGYSDRGAYCRPRCVQRILNYRACRTAVMFGDSLSRQQQQAILDGLKGCALPFQCAHGRPTMQILLADMHM